MRPIPACACLCLLGAGLFSLGEQAWAETQKVVIRDDQVKSFPDDPSQTSNLVRYVDLERAVVANPADARILIDRAIADKLADDITKANPKAAAKDFYCIIHVVRWSESNPNPNDKTQNIQTVKAQNWYLYHDGKRTQWSQEDFTTTKQLLEARKVWLLYIHLKTDTQGSAQPVYVPRYEFDITKKTPANLSNLIALLQLAIGLRPTEAPTPTLKSFWGMRSVDVNYVPSSIIVTAKTEKRGSAEAPQALGDPPTFDDEARYYWDVSVAVPAKKISELKFDASSNTVTAQKVDKEKLFALINVYLPPTDLRNPTNHYIPHFVGGVAIDSRPLHKILLGVGWGFKFAQLYTAALLVKQDRPNTLKTGDTATSNQLSADLSGRYKTQFSIGINLPVRGVLDTLKKEKKK